MNPDSVSVQVPDIADGVRFIDKMLRNPNYLYGDDTALKVPTHLNFAKYVLHQIWLYEDRIALINGKTHEKLTFRELAKDAMHLGVSLARMGVRKGDTIGVCSENRREYFSTSIGVICTGATLTCVNPAYTEGELKHVLGISKPKMIFCSPNAYKTHAKTLEKLPYLHKVTVYGKEKPNNTVLYEDLIKPTTEDEISVENFEVMDVVGQIDTAVILYSSGTTGLPKGVMLTHLNFIATCELPYTMDPNEISLLVTPWYHVMGMLGALRIFCYGGTLVHLQKFDADLYMKTIETYKVAQVTVAPPILIAICKTPSNYDVSTIKMVYSGAAPLRDETIAAVKARFPELKAVLQGYGMTESTLAVTRDTYTDAQNSRSAGVGRALPSTIIKIVDAESRKVLGPNQAGEICIRGPMIMKGYVGKDRGEDFDDEGFFRTGDIGYYDNDKYLYIVDRLKELIKYKGYQVAPAEVEAVLLQHPGIRDAGVVGVPHETGGEVPLAFVVLQSGYNLSEDMIKAFVAEKLSNPKHIRGGVCFVSEIPKTPSGKIMRKRLRDMAKTRSKL